MSPGFLRLAYRDLLTRYNRVSHSERTRAVWSLYVCQGADGRVTFIDQIEDQRLFQRVKGFSDEIHFFE